MNCPSIREWQDRGKVLEINGFKIFYLDEGDADEVLCILHGYPSCSYDYYKVIPLLSKRYRVVVHDHLGFGFSGRPLDYSYSLIEQADIAVSLWEHLDLDGVHILAHDYGTSVATELIARSNLGYEPVKMKSVTLGNGSMLIELAKLLPIQRLLKTPGVGQIVVNLTSNWLFRKNMSKLWYDKSKISLDELDNLYQIMWLDKDSRKVFPRVSRYIDERFKFWHRWIGGLEKSDKTINLLWADKDPVAIVKMAYVLESKIKDCHMELMPDVGHYPMLESPEIYANLFMGILEKTKA